MIKTWQQISMTFENLAFFVVSKKQFAVNVFRSCFFI